ncbi:MAG: UDP-N-acetylmuramoyl-tripeptide--D-alanyl-D-alanine ligase [Hydrogenophilales bacterium CG15_BIG_FIL_POST_REV_8_21_14_020_62_31]|nr:MAG: UDP-N-acetylmuramoyl-tripeptide--D-alanyl-D-alanine ligase [Hydrogenophilales bacterium CG15_BIG_FIL_POST_REV_8_21_14_020_62_31]
MRLHEAALALNARAIGPDVEFGAVASDSRNLLAGALFVALRGERFDGHRFAAQALAQGAAAVMVDSQANLDLAPAIIVPDTRLALGQLAAWQRRRMPAKVLAITGSNGKTTVKEMLAAILKRSAGESAVLATVGNLNNDIGMPLTLLRLTPEHRYAVLEMGMNHPGELNYLSRLAQPDAALVNNALRAHLAGLGSVEAVAKAKAEIYAGLKADGVALVNADDPHAALLRALAGSHRCVDFGLAQGDIRADYQLHDFASDMTLHTPAGAVELTLNVPGLHNVCNALAAAAMAHVAGVSRSDIGHGLAAYTGVKGRLQPHACILGARLIDDSYNANPDSVAAAIAVLAAQPGKRILALGDMGELGAGAAGLHGEIGVSAKRAGIDRLLCLGELTVHTVQAFGPGAMHFERIEELLAELEQALGPEVTVLVKGSRFMQMERVVKSFIEEHVCS